MTRVETIQTREKKRETKPKGIRYLRRTRRQTDGLCDVDVWSMDVQRVQRRGEEEGGSVTQPVKRTVTMNNTKTQLQTKPKQQGEEIIYNEYVA